MSKSIISNDKICYICKTPFNIHKHHIFFGTSNRKQSEKYGCWCYLCANHHNMSDYGVHFDKSLDTKLKQLAQKKFIEMYQDLEFMKVFGKNWL